MDGREPVIFRQMKVERYPRRTSCRTGCFSVPWSRDLYSELTKNDSAYYVVAEIDGEIVGYAGVWVILDEGHVTNIAVHPKHRRKGIGRQLMEAITAYAACEWSA